MEYATLKVIHMLGIVLFLGNIIVSGVWKVMANRTRSPEIIAFGQRLITLTDWVFTAGGVVLVIVSGYGMARVGGYDLLGDTWLFWAQALFIASGVIWVVVLVPVQTKQARLARGFAEGDSIPEAYWRLERQWGFWGIVATLLPLVNLYWMVFKP